MDQGIFVSQLNIQHYRQKLASEHDDAKRRTISRLLAEEEAKLAAFQKIYAERSLNQLLEVVARQAPDLFDNQYPGRSLRASATLAATLEEMPLAVGLSDRTGKVIMANIAMRRFAPTRVPSSDAQSIQRWRAFDAERRPLTLTDWPGPRALRGETVRPGVDFVYATDDGRQVMTRVSAMPVRYAGGDIAGAIGVVEELGVSSENR